MVNLGLGTPLPQPEEEPKDVSSSVGMGTEMSAIQPPLVEPIAKTKQEPLRKTPTKLNPEQELSKLVTPENKKNVLEMINVGRQFNYKPAHISAIVASAIHESGANPAAGSQNDLIKGVPQSFGLNQWKGTRLTSLLKEYYVNESGVQDFLRKRETQPNAPVDSQEAKVVKKALGGSNSIKKQFKYMLGELNPKNQIGNLNSVGLDVSGIGSVGIAKFHKINNNPNSKIEDYVRWQTQYGIRPANTNFQSKNRTKTANMINSLFLQGKNNGKK